MLALSCGAPSPIVEVASHDHDQDGSSGGAQTAAPEGGTERDHGDGVSTRSDEATCAEYRRLSAEALDSAVSNLSSGCREDADCVLADYVTSCFSGCPTSILTTQREAYERVRASVDSSHCSRYEADGCPRIERRCVDERAACADGMCVVGLADGE